MQPGKLMGLPNLSDAKEMNCEMLTLWLQADYLFDPNVGQPSNGKCPVGYHKLRAEVTPDGVGFHVKRENPDGSWSEQQNQGSKPRFCDPTTPTTDGDIQCPDICVPN
jgi:hypothetical protein